MSRVLIENHSKSCATLPVSRIIISSKAIVCRQCQTAWPPRKTRSRRDKNLSCMVQARLFHGLASRPMGSVKGYRRCLPG
jgi:hypothetical protein